jgi:cell division septation protein DedD
MEEDHRRGREYYQVNLDMGRLFWIVFLIGIILIGVFIFGFFIGGDRGSGRSRLDLLKLGQSDMLRGERIVADRTRDDLKILDLLDKDLEAETRFIDVQSLEKAAQEGDAASGMKPAEPEPVSSVYEKPIEKPALPETAYVRAPESAGTAVVPHTPVYRPVGDYYIQVASFTDKSNAEQLAERLRKNLYKVELETAEVDGKTFHRVKVGPFEKRSVAVNTMTSMKRIFKLTDPFVVKKQS